jgi:hypothetical protein
MRHTWVLMIFVLLAGCGMNAKIKRLTPPEKAEYEALRAYMTDAEKKEWLKIRKQPERDKWLKTHGAPKNYWDLWYQYDKDTQDKILSGDVKVGWTKEMVVMAWGRPREMSQLTGRPASYSERFNYRFEVQDDGTTLVWTPGSKTEYKAVDKYQVDVIIDDRVVTELRRIDHWE